MGISKGRKICALITAVCAVVLGFTVGMQFNIQTPITITYEKTAFTGLKDIIDTSFSLCTSQMIQLFAIYISGFTFFSYPVSVSVLAWRSMLFSRTLAFGINILPISSLVPIVSYGVVTLFAVYLSYKSMTFERIYTEKRPLVSAVLSQTRIFLTVSGASVFAKILPMYIFCR